MMLQINLIVISLLVAEIFMFERMNTQTYTQTDGCQLDGYTISSPCQPLAQVSLKLTDLYKDTCSPAFSHLNLHLPNLCMCTFEN